jgi:hypothetical protein
MAAPVQSYCFTVQTDLIGLAMLTSAPPKPDGMQAVAFVPEMSHFHAQMGRIFADQLSYYLAKKEGESSIGQCLQQEYSKRVATTSRAIKGQNSACKFGFSVYWHPDVKWWFFPKEQARCKHHSGHLKVPLHLVNLSIKALPPDEIQLAKDGTLEFMKTSMLEAFIHRRNDVTISRDRLKYYQLGHSCCCC